MPVREAFQPPHRIGYRPTIAETNFRVAIAAPAASVVGVTAGSKRRRRDRRTRSRSCEPEQPTNPARSRSTQQQQGSAYAMVGQIAWAAMAEVGACCHPAI